ncbi:unnamed protein product [Gulo gulo]|uniref:CWH43-like N-terminal domain-containing protein n=1 Tax=Gulo gulo TaxID=48420 RepID=A0A9X9LEJ8_GULGU|nr:unnamed protein product [Gulo gulo]
MLCFLRGMAFVPFLLVTWSSAAFIISYVVAVLSGHVNPFLPYISDTGTTPPESGIFGFMINFSAFLGAATMYTRYKIVEKQNQTSYFSTPVFNLVSLVLGLVGCIGMGIVANFQELAVPVVHDGGALLAFVCGVVYTLLQSIISYKSCPQWNSLSTCHVRLAISAISCAAVVPSILCIFVSVFTGLTFLPLPQKSMKKKAKVNRRVSTCFRRPIGRKVYIVKEIPQHCLVRSKQSLGGMCVQEGRKLIATL